MSNRYESIMAPEGSQERASLRPTAAIGANDAVAALADIEICYSSGRSQPISVARGQQPSKSYGPFCVYF